MLRSLTSRLMAPWQDAAKSNDANRMAALISQHRGSMLHRWGFSVCASCSSRSPDGRRWECCRRTSCANYGSNWNGNTALHDAAAAGHVNIIEQLVGAGASVNATNKLAKTPLDLARTDQTAQLLRAHGGLTGSERRPSTAAAEQDSQDVEGASGEPQPASPESPRPSSPGLNASTLSGAIDVIAVRQADGSLRSTAFHVRRPAVAIVRKAHVHWPTCPNPVQVRFGKLLAPFPLGKPCRVIVNRRPASHLSLSLGSEGEVRRTHNGPKRLIPSHAFCLHAVPTSDPAAHANFALRYLDDETQMCFTPTPEELSKMDLDGGVNHLEYTCGGRPVVARLFLLTISERLLICDVDGTITRSDFVGHVPRGLVPRFVDRFHPGIVPFLSGCAANGYRVVYLTARPIGLAAPTLELLASAEQVARVLRHAQLCGRVERPSLRPSRLHGIRLHSLHLSPRPPCDAHLWAHLTCGLPCIHTCRCASSHSHLPLPPLRAERHTAAGRAGAPISRPHARVLRSRGKKRGTPPRSRPGARSAFCPPHARDGRRLNHCMRSGHQEDG